MRIPATILSIIATGLLVQPAVADSPPELGSVTAAFELVNVEGEIIRFKQFHGKNVLVAFGFTNCVHICPMIAANMARAIRDSGKNAVGVFVSVDTERDTPTITQAYASKFGDKMIGLSGNHRQVSDAAQNFGVTYVVTKSENTYTVQHTPTIFLIGPEGELVETFAMNSPSADIAAAMQ